MVRPHELPRDAPAALVLVVVGRVPMERRRSDASQLCACALRRAHGADQFPPLAEIEMRRHWILHAQEWRRRSGDVVIIALAFVGACWIFWRVIELLSE
jgi:hypothetical protein